MEQGQRILLLVVFLLCGGIAAAQEYVPNDISESSKTPEHRLWEASVHPKYTTWPAMRFVREDSTLPRALLIGDSISIGYTSRVQEALKGKVNVFRIPVNGGSTKEGLAGIDQWLGDKAWDVIHFNWGLHDLKRQVEGSPNPDQLDVGGRVNIPLDNYEQNLATLLTRLERTGARLIWATTTPIPDEAMGRVRGDEMIYNAAAEKIMKHHSVRINDLHRAIQPHLEIAQPPKDVHFRDEGNDILASIVADEILAALAEPSPAKATRTPAPITLRSQGAIGDGKTDDRAAIQAALMRADGAHVDGEGLTYAVHGNIEVTASVDFRNARLDQTMGPADTARFIPSARGEGGALHVEPPEALRRTVKGFPYMVANGVGTYEGDPIPTEADLAALLPSIVLRTLSIRGEAQAPVSVNLDKVVIDRGRHPQTGGRNDGYGVKIDYASPVNMRDVEITGDGKGTGLGITNCSKVRLERLHIHDMTWAPYDGDDVLERLTADEVRDDFGWNNFPIYEYRAGMKRFVRVRIQEQLVGIFVLLSQDVEILDSKIEGLQTRIVDQLYPLQSDGMTINRVSNIRISNCELSKVWEGIDFTGSAGRDFVFEGCTVSDTLGWAFKLAHPKQNGKIINCTAKRAGISGFLIGGQSENIKVIDCIALETGANGYWTRADGSHVMDISGFRIDSGGADSPTPRQIKVDRCAAINRLHPGAMDYGMLSRAVLEGRDITLGEFTVEGAKVEDIRGFPR